MLIHTFRLNVSFVSFCSTWAVLKYWSQCAPWTSTRGRRWQGTLLTPTIGNDQSGHSDPRCIASTEVSATMLLNYTNANDGVSALSWSKSKRNCGEMLCFEILQGHSKYFQEGAVKMKCQCKGVLQWQQCSVVCPMRQIDPLYMCSLTLHVCIKLGLRVSVWRCCVVMPYMWCYCYKSRALCNPLPHGRSALPLRLSPSSLSSTIDGQ